MTDIAKIGFAVDTSQLDKGVASLTKLSSASHSTSASVKNISTSMTSAAKIFAGAVAGMNKGVLALISATKGVKTEQIAAAKEASSFADRIYAAAAAQEKLAVSTNKAKRSLQEMYKTMLKAASTESVMSRVNRITGVTGLKRNSALDSYEAMLTGWGEKELLRRAGHDISNRGLTEAQQASRFRVGGIAAQFQDIAVTAGMGMNPVLIGMQQGTQLASYLADGVKGLGDAFKLFLGPVTMASIALTTLAAGLIQLVNWTKVAESVLNGIISVFEFIADKANVITGTVLTLGAAFAVFKSDVLIGKASDFMNSIDLKDMVIKKWEDLKEAWKSLKQVAGDTFKKIGGWIASHPVQALTLAIIGAAAAWVMFSESGKNAINKSIGYAAAGAYAIGGIMEAGFSAIYKGWDKAWADFKDDLNSLINKDYLGDAGDALASVAEKGAKAFEKLKNKLYENKKEAEKLKKAWEDLKKSAEGNIAGLKLEKSLIGAGTYEQTYQQTLFDLTQQAKDKGIDLYGKDNKIDQLRAYAEETAYLTTEVKAQTEAYDFAKSSVNGFFSDMRQGLKQGQSVWESFGNAVMNVLDKILDKILEIGVDALFQAGSASGKDSWFNTALSYAGSWFTMGSGGTTSYNPATTPPPVKPTMAANGGVFSNGIYSSPTLFAFAKGGQFGVMGEAGPEAVMPLTRGPDGSLGVRADGGSAAPVVVNVINNSDAQARTERRQTSQGTEIDVIIDQMVAEKMNQPGTSSNNALRAFSNQKLIAR